MLARELFGIWVSRGFPMAAVQFVTISEARRTVITQRYELPEGARPPAWLDPERGGVADPGLFHTVFLSASKLIEIGRLTASQGERKARMLTLDHTIFNWLTLPRIGAIAAPGRSSWQWRRKPVPQRNRSMPAFQATSPR